MAKEATESRSRSEITSLCGAVMAPWWFPGSGGPRPCAQILLPGPCSSVFKCSGFFLPSPHLSHFYQGLIFSAESKHHLARLGAGGTSRGGLPMVCCPLPLHLGAQQTPLVHVSPPVVLPSFLNLPFSFKWTKVFNSVSFKTSSTSWCLRLRISATVAPPAHAAKS